MGQHRIDAILIILLPGTDRPHLHRLDHGIDKGKPLPVRGRHRCLAGQIHIALPIGRDLPFTLLAYCRLHHFLQALRGCGNRFYHRATQLLAQQLDIDQSLFLLVNVRLIQRHHHGYAQFQQLGGKKQAAAEIGGVHDVDDHIRMLLLNIGAGHAFLCGKGGHRIRTGQVHRHQVLLSCIDFFDRRFLFLHRHTGPVAHLLVAARQGVVHGGLAGVGIACKCNSHIVYSFYTV